MKVLHVIAGLGQGGAEATLVRLAVASAAQTQHFVVSLTQDLHFAPLLESAGVPVHALDARHVGAAAGSVFRLKTIIKSTNPDVVQTWMYHADLLGGLAARWAGSRAVVWGVRHSRLEPGKSSLSSRMAALACARLSAFAPAAIACCSRDAARVHIKMGYRADKFVVIHNGYDLRQLAPDAAARTRLRAQWHVAPGDVLLGMVARWDPCKDHANLLGALAKLAGKSRAFRCVLVGRGMVDENRQLTAAIAGFGLAGRMILAGPRDDVPAVMNALDIHVLSSAGEAFPNTVAEAMACGTPCVVTDVGDAALIVGDTGWVVPARDATSLAQGISSALQALTANGRDELAKHCRERIQANFDLAAMVSAYHSLWARVTRLQPEAVCAE